MSVNAIQNFFAGQNYLKVVEICLEGSLFIIILSNLQAQLSHLAIPASPA